MIPMFFTPRLWKQEWLDGEHVIFGELLEGKEIILNMEPHGTKVRIGHPVSGFFFVQVKCTGI